MEADEDIIKAKAQEIADSNAFKLAFASPILVKDKRGAYCTVDIPEKVEFNVTGEFVAYYIPLSITYIGKRDYTPHVEAEVFIDCMVTIFADSQINELMKIRISCDVRKRAIDFLKDKLTVLWDS